MNDKKLVLFVDIFFPKDLNLKISNPFKKIKRAIIIAVSASV